MFNAIIVDDEKPALDVLRILLEKSGQISVIGEFMNATDALAKIEILKPDVAFLDIEMPDMSGLELAGKIIDSVIDIEIVFVTAYDKYALEAFRVNAIDYILKPFSSNDIAQAIKKLKKVKPLLTHSPIPADKGRIYCFGRLSLYGAGCTETVIWRTSKTEELFAFMLQNLNKSVSKWKITQALWPECEIESQLNTNLHTTIYRLKKTLLSAKIKFDFTFINGSYKMALPEIYLDTDEFEALIDPDIPVTEASIERYRKALDLYKGNYLEENEYLWAQRQVEEYETKYCRLVSYLAQYYIMKKDYVNAEEILQKALSIIPLNDDLNEMLLKLFLLKEDKASLAIHFKKIKELYKTELGITPNMAMQDLYNRIL